MKGWKTILFAIIGGALSSLEAFNWMDVLPDAYEPFAIPVIFAVFAWLRKLTTTPVGESN